MRKSLIISALLHAVVLLGGLYSFTHHLKPELTQQQFVPVEILTPAEFTKLKAGVKDGADTPPAPKIAENKPEQSHEKQSAAPVKPAPPAPREPAAAPPKAAAPPPKPEKVELPEKKPEPPKPQKTAERKPEPAPTPTPAKPRETPSKRAHEPDRIAGLLNRQDTQKKQEHRAEKSKFDAEKIAALLNRVPDAGRPAPSEPKPRTPWRPAGSLDDQASTNDAPPAKRMDQLPQGVSTGTAAQMSVNEIDAFRSQISRCWSPPASGLGDQTLIVKLHIELNQDGSLLRPPQVMNSGGSPFFQVAADSAVRAVFECQPYLMPRSKYGQWRDMVLNFDPRQMYGG